MSDEEIEAVLQRLDGSHKLPCSGGTLEVWRDFDSEETRIRIPRGPMVRVDEHHLRDLVNEQAGTVTDDRIIQLLCDIYRQPGRYPGIAL